jgi:hypothetical protein
MTVQRVANIEIGAHEVLKGGTSLGFTEEGSTLAIEHEVVPRTAHELGTTPFDLMRIGTSATMTLNLKERSLANLIAALSGTQLAEMVTNGSFAADTDWTHSVGSPAWVISAGVASVTASDTGTPSVLEQDVSAVASRVYAVSVEVTAISAGSFTVSLGGTAHTESISTTGVHTFEITTVSTANLIFTTSDSAATTCSIDNVSVRPNIVDLNATPGALPTAEIQLQPISASDESETWTFFKASITPTGATPFKINEDQVWPIEVKALLNQDASTGNIELVRFGDTTTAPTTGYDPTA